MRWLRRSVLLCLLVVVVTPAPAHAWFEWLDRLSGPGRWYGMKLDVRALCFGAEIPIEATNRAVNRLAEGVRLMNTPEIAAAEDDLLAVLNRFRELNSRLNILSPDEIRDIENRIHLRRNPSNVVRVTREQDLESIRSFAQRFERNARMLATPGILVSLCPSNKLRSVALELGLTWLGTPGNEQYAQEETIWMTTVTAGLSYRIPLPVDRDFIDLGTNLGVYRFYSQGFEDFSGFTIEPFVDLHVPTRLQLDGSKWERFFGRFTLRAGLQFFPGGFKAAQFASAPGKPDISGREASASATVFFRVKG